MRRFINFVITASISLNLCSQTWFPLSTGLNMPISHVNCFTVYNNKLIVGGDFTSVGGNNTNNIGVWDGSSWSTLNTGLSGGYKPPLTPYECPPKVNSLAVFNNELYAGGTFTVAGTTTLNCLAKWNGVSWSNVVSNIGVVPFTSSNKGIITSLLVYNGFLYVTGSFTSIGGVTANGIAKWDGVNWFALGNGITGGTANSLAIFNNDLIVGGTFTVAGATTVLNIAGWNGSAWSSLGQGLPTNNLSGVGVMCLEVYNSELYAGGSSSGISKWNGSNWSSVGGGLGPASQSAAKSMVIYNNKLIVGGFFSSAGLDAITYIAAWDGTSWSYVGGYSLILNGLGNEVTAATVYNSSLYVGGQFSYSNDFPQVFNLNHIARFSGTVGLEEYSINSPLRVSPNPSTGQISFNDLIGANSIYIFDLTGRLIHHEICNNQTLTIDLGTKDKGVYMYKIIDSEYRVQQGRLIIQ